MNFFSDNALFVEAILVVLLLAALVVIYIQSCNLQDLKHSKSKKGSSSGSVSKEKHKEIVESRNQYRDAYSKKKSEYDKLLKEYQTIQRKKLEVDDRYGKLCIDYNNLKQDSLKTANGNLIRENAELNKLVGNEPEPIVVADSLKEHSIKNKTEEQSKDDVFKSDEKVEDTQNSSVKNKQAADRNVVVTIVEPEAKDSKPEPQPQTPTAKDATMYASFPRSAGSSVYFSDLTEILADDSYFEIIISNTSGKATFKPLDFMKIRNFDVAWNAMISEGVKPAAATSVCGIEPGKAHKEGNDLIVDNPAKIKLA